MMASTFDEEPSERERHSIHIGGVYASRTGAVIRTLLGSCIAVCLRDPISRVGGMNHFMLPNGYSDDPLSSRYGVHAMELLINRCMKLGAERCRLEAKVFGAAHVLRVEHKVGNVAEVNAAFIKEFLTLEGIPTIAEDVGGQAAREIYFFTDSGRTMLRRLESTIEKDLNMVARLARNERARIRAQRETQETSVTLFGGD